MNDFDRENIEYLLSCSQEEFSEWADAMDTDTLFYMLNLIQQAKAELVLEEIELREVGGIEDFTEAQAVLSRFTLKG